MPLAKTSPNSTFKYGFLRHSLYFSRLGKKGPQHTNNKPVPQATPDTPELTEAELRFMSEQMGDTDSECMTAGGESDIGSECGMPEEVEAAYQEFLNEQAKASKESK